MSVRIVILNFLLNLPSRGPTGTFHFHCGFPLRLFGFEAKGEKNKSQLMGGLQVLSTVRIHIRS